MSSSSSFVEPSCFPSPSPLPPPSEDPLPSQLLSVKSKYHDDIRRFKVEKRIQAIRQHVAAAYGLQHFSIFFSEPLTFDLVTIDSDKELNLALEILSIDTPKDVLTVISASLSSSLLLLLSLSLWTFVYLSLDLDSDSLLLNPISRPSQGQSERANLFHGRVGYRSQRSHQQNHIIRKV